MTMDRHVDIAAKLDAYALGQLSQDERLEVESHLRVCSTCVHDLRELNAVFEGIAETAPPIEPSAPLRERVLAAVAQESQDGGPVAHAIDVVRTRRPLSSFLPLAAAAVLVAAVSVLAWRIDQSRRQIVDQLAETRAANVELKERLQRYAGQTDLALSILTAGDMHEIPLAGSENAASTAARAYLSPTRGLLLVADRLPAPPPGRIYQVWIIEGKTAMSAGLLGEEPGGRGMLIVTPPRDGISSSVTVAVTDEPPGGLPSPSGTIRLAGSI